MGELQRADTRLSGRFGLLLLLLMPTDIVITQGVGDYLVTAGLDRFSALPFIGMTVPLAALPIIGIRVEGRFASGGRID